MSPFKFATSLSLSLILLMSASVVRAATLYVNCGGKGGLTTIGAALKSVQYIPGPNTINVSGACHENVVIQNLDRLTINGAPGTSINDVSGGNADTVQVAGSQSVTINSLTINGGASGVDCLLGSLCYLNGNTVQGAAGGAGVNAGALSRVFVSASTLQNNFFGISAQNGGGVWAIGVLIQQNRQGVNLVSQSILQTNATITANAGTGVLASTSATLNCNGCTVTGNGDHGLILRRNSSARIVGGYAITGNAGGGVLLSEESSASFEQGNVTGNTGGLDVACGASATSAKFATVNIGGGTTNCVEPVDP
jgi:Right handed beta helix region